MGNTSKDIPERQELTDKEKELWTTYWLAGSFAASKMAKLARAMSLAMQLQVQDVGFDIHITGVAPRVSGGVTTSVGGHNFFHDLDDLVVILENNVSWMKGEI